MAIIFNIFKFYNVFPGFLRPVSEALPSPDIAKVLPWIFPHYLLQCERTLVFFFCLLGQYHFVHEVIGISFTCNWCHAAY